MATTPVVHDSALKRHRPLSGGEALPASSVPVSGASGNIAELRPDGVYVPGEFSVDDPNAVKLSGDQTVSGVKTFLSPVRGDLDGTASRAVNDGDGYQISGGYVKVGDLVTNQQIDAMFA